MTSARLSWPKRHPLVAYVIIAYLVSWAIEIPLALKAQAVTETSPPFWIHYLAAFGPFLAALMMTWVLRGRAGLKELLSRTIRWRVSVVWWLVALSPLLLFFVGAAVLRLVEGEWLDMSMLGRVDFLPELGILAVFLWLATYGFGEEIGWRGFLLPRLQQGRTAWSATLVLWLFWASWHVPSFFYLHTAPNVGALAGFLVGVLSGAIVLTWLYNSSGGSVLMVAIWHGLFDYTTGCTECKAGLISAGLSTIIMIWAVLAVIIFKPAMLSRSGKHVIGDNLSP